MSYENIPKNTAETAVLTDGVAKDYFVEVAKGNVAGASLGAITGKNRTVGTSIEDVWGVGGVMVYPTAAEGLELVSADVNDTSAGTGVRTVLVTGLDIDYEPISEVVTTSGGTVALVTPFFRVLKTIALTAGSVGTNIGDITVQVAGGGAVRDVMIADEGVSYSGHYTVPAGKVLYVTNSFTLFDKDSAGETRARVKASAADAAWSVAAPVPAYQNLVTFEVKALLPLPEKFELQLQGKATTGTADVTIIFEYLLLDMEA